MTMINSRAIARLLCFTIGPDGQRGKMIMLDNRQTEGTRSTGQQPENILRDIYGQQPGQWFGRRYTYEKHGPNGRQWLNETPNGIIYDIVQTADPALFDLIVWAQQKFIIDQYTGSINGIKGSIIDNYSRHNVYGSGRALERYTNFTREANKRRAKINSRAKIERIRAQLTGTGS